MKKCRIAPEVKEQIISRIKTDSSQNSTPPRSGVRSEVICKASGRVVVVPVVVEPVPVHHHLATVLYEVRDVEVAVAVLHDCTKCRPFHCSLNTRRAVSYSASVMPQHFASSIFIF